MVDWCVGAPLSVSLSLSVSACSLCAASRSSAWPSRSADDPSPARSTPYAGEISPEFLLKAALGSVNKALDG